MATNQSATFNGIWKMGDTIITGSPKKELLLGFTQERFKPQAFIQYVSQERGIFKGLFDSQRGLHEGFLFAGAQPNMTRLNKVVDRIAKETISACWDCNSNMTQMEYVKLMFDAFFPLTNPFPETGFNLTEKTNVRLHYLLLQALLPTGCIHTDADGHQKFDMTTALSTTWRLNLVITWCFLMIMSCQWNIGKLHAKTPQHEHHEVYLLHGVSDFYLSLLLYTVYAANFPDGRDDILEFEEFHFFYSTNFVFYLKRANLLATNPRPDTLDNNNLSLSILHSQAMAHTILGGALAWTEVPQLDIPAWPANDDPRTVRDTVWTTTSRFHAKITEFIDKHFKSFCHQLYDWGSNGDPGHFTQFFAAPTHVQAMVLRTRDETDLSVQTFIRVLGSHDRYWFPFKHITMVQIANALEKGYTKTIRHFRPMFSLWYHHASTSALLLARAPSLVETHRAEANEEEDDDTGLLLRTRNLTMLH
jgi:hypothetical protein